MRSVEPDMTSDPGNQNDQDKENSKTRSWFFLIITKLGVCHSSKTAILITHTNGLTVSSFMSGKV